MDGMTPEPPRFEPLDLRCQACRHEWTGWQPVQVPVAVWVAVANVLHCPACGAGADRIVIPPQKDANRDI